ncbi:DUF3817 domain-containing protein [Nocardia mangyaensis]|uniref:DUF3817 domain-containing protein n=1 Tax=Nocardia mangyaensis TaxID=2213200 RepID=UPI00267664EB|nr:DUF3817 domain-containing protein [Nocardia mangyaensis]MDO3648004.1 DUF3817 domain-containing protein [Nocardia mangyaensis]
MTTDENTTAPSLENSAPAPDTAKIASALLRYRALAWFTGLWLLLLTVEMIAKYGFGVDTPSWVAVVHGWVYFAYLLVTADLAVKVRWPIGRTIGTLLAGTIPLLSFFVEHRNAKDVKEQYSL